MSSETSLDSICYQKNFLTEVIARVDLVSPLPGLDNELPVDILKRVRENFPIAEPKPISTQEVQISPKELTSRKQNYIEWNFYGLNREKQLTIMPTCFFVSYKIYNVFEDLQKDFLSVAEVVCDKFKQAQPTRFGLRYINQLDVQGSNPLDWKEHIDPKLLGLFSFPIEGAIPSRVFHIYEVVFDDYNLRFQFGIHNPDYPAAIRQRAFILDYDAYCGGLIDPKDIPMYLKKFHNAIQGLFEQSITTELREVMKQNE